MIIGSANNAANALARATGLAKSDFVAKMNAKAAELGLTKTSFADPTGIKVENLSTAHEVALMSLKAFRYPAVAALAGEPTYHVATIGSRGAHDIVNTNKLVKDGEVEVAAGTTGFIYEAGYTLTTILRKLGERDLLVVVLGCDSQYKSFRDAKVLAEQAWLGEDNS
jgi:D-alanyl-D-alanine endopeptidase (penicillin-binding protein 7)